MVTADRPFPPRGCCGGQVSKGKTIDGARGGKHCIAIRALDGSGRGVGWRRSDCDGMDMASLARREFTRVQEARPGSRSDRLSTSGLCVFLISNRLSLGQRRIQTRRESRGDGAVYVWALSATSTCRTEGLILHVACVVRMQETNLPKAVSV